MKANELMIGDWVNVYHELPDESGFYKPLQITGIHRNEGICFGHNVIESPWNDPEEFESIQPITLTPEILEKNGFYKINAMEAELDVEGEDTVYSLEIKEPYTIVEVEDTDQDLRWVNLRVKGEGCEKLVQYVHELQHVFRFFGVEKEIVL